MKKKSFSKKLAALAPITAVAVAAVVVAPADAAIKEYVTQDTTGTLLSYDYDALLTSYGAYVVDESSDAAKLWVHFTTNKAVAVLDNSAAGKYVSYAAMLSEYNNAVVAGEVFNPNAYSEDAAATPYDVPQTVKQVTVNAEGEIVETEVPADGTEVVEKLTVESVSAITTTTVDVNITAPEKDVLGATIVVLDNNKNKVEVKAVDISAGDKVASFTFVTPVEKLEGVWSVEGKEYSFTEIEQLKAITDAAEATTLDQVKLLTALNDAGIKNVNEDSLEAYAKAINDADPNVSSLDDVQKVIDAANVVNEDDAAKEAVVKSVVEASNQVQLLKVLQANFDRINADWIVSYSTDDSGNGADLIALEESDAATFEDIQDAIDGVNLIQVGTKVADANMKLDSKKVSEARALVNAYIVDDQEDGQPTKATALNLLDLEDALIAINTATTNNSLKNALVNLDTFENAMLDKYPSQNLSDEFDIKTVKDELLSKYRTAVKDAEVGKKNQRKDIQTIVNEVNGDADAAVLTSLKKVVTDGVQGTTANEKAAQDALVSFGIKNVLPTGYLTSAAKSAIASAADKDAVQTAVNDANLIEVKVVVNAGTAGVTTDETKVANYLTTFGVANVLPTGYLTSAAKSAIASAADKDAVQTAVNNANAITNAAKYVKAVNEATTATEARSALAPVALASTASAAYLELTATAKLEVAELFLAIKTADRANLVDGKYTSVADIKTDLNSVTSSYGTLIGDVNVATTISVMKDKLNAIDYDAFTSLNAAAQLDVAEAFIAKFPATDKNVRVDYATLSAIKAGIDAAITAVNNGEVLPTPPTTAP